jgi:hypothetical protein
MEIDSPTVRHRVINVGTIILLLHKHREANRKKRARRLGDRRLGQLDMSLSLLCLLPLPSPNSNKQKECLN